MSIFTIFTISHQFQFSKSNLKLWWKGTIHITRPVAGFQFLVEQKNSWTVHFGRSASVTHVKVFATEWVRDKIWFVFFLWWTLGCCWGGWTWFFSCCRCVWFWTWRWWSCSFNWCGCLRISCQDNWHQDNTQNNKDCQTKFNNKVLVQKIFSFQNKSDKTYFSWWIRFCKSKFGKQFAD